MKKKVISAALCLALMLALLPHAAGAVKFPDIQTHWAKADIERAVDESLFKGYEDGSFRPDYLMLTSEALALCARIAVPDADLRAKIGTARKDEMSGLLGDQLAWFFDDFATCLETGILHHSELERLIRGDLLKVPMLKGEFSRYLTYAMGMGGLALSLDEFTLSYLDAGSIPEACRSSIYLLDLYGVVNGTDKGEIQPLSPLSRAVAATMLVRVIDTMHDLNIAFELPRYTDYPWTAGYIAEEVTVAANGGVLISIGGIYARQTILLPADGMVYQGNKPAQRTVLKTGAYVKLALTADGYADSVRVIPAEELDEVSGVVSELTPDELVLGLSTYFMNRFTAVTATGKTGDRSIIDYNADYTVADCVVDNLGNILHLTLHGGTRELTGIVSAVEVSPVTAVATVSVSGYDGRVTRYTIPASVPVTSSGLSTALNANSVGAHVTLRVNSDDPSDVLAVDVDLVSRYLQGSINTISTLAPTTMTIATLPEARVGTYQIAEGCVLTFAGEPTALAAIKTGSYVTARLQGGQLVEVHAWPGVVETAGTLASITFSPTVVLMTVTEDNGQVASFSIPVTDLKDVAITRGGNSTGIQALSTGDSVTVRVRYNAVTGITATPRSADITGVVQEVAFNAAGATITLLLPSGESMVFSAAAGVTVVQDGSISALNNIRVGATLALVTEGERIVSIDIQQTAASSVQLEGVVYTKEAGGRKLTIAVSDEAGGTKLVVVNILSSVTAVQDAREGSIGINRITAGDVIQVWGNYNKQEFDATVVVRTQ